MLMKRGLLASKSIQKRAIGIQIRYSLKLATWVDRMVRKAYGMPAFISQDMEKAQCYVKTLVMPLSSALCTGLVLKDVITLEEVQGRFIRLFPGLEVFNYGVRVNKLGLFLVGNRRLTYNG